jgi:hypothetical protein
MFCHEVPPTFANSDAEVFLVLLATTFIVAVAVIVVVAFLTRTAFDVTTICEDAVVLPSRILTPFVVCVAVDVNDIGLVISVALPASTDIVAVDVIFACPSFTPDTYPDAT